MLLTDILLFMIIYPSPGKILSNTVSCSPLAAERIWYMTKCLIYLQKYDLLQQLFCSSQPFLIITLLHYRRRLANKKLYQYKTLLHNISSFKRIIIFFSLLFCAFSRWTFPTSWRHIEPFGIVASGVSRQTQMKLPFSIISFVRINIDK